MKRLFELQNDMAKMHFLKGSSYFNGDFPHYLSFEKILEDVGTVFKNGPFNGFTSEKPGNIQGVNYSFVANKDGRFSWRPFELIHPAIYVALVDLICESDSWRIITNRLKDFENGVVECCSAPVMSISQNSDKASQVKKWWQAVEQRSLQYSLEFSHLLHTDVADCYGSLYTHSVSWAIHGKETAKSSKRKHDLLGNKIDNYLQAGRYGQTNGISQGSILMDFIAEIVLGYVDQEISSELKKERGFRILRYRDDYRIFSNSDNQAEKILKVISDKLRSVGMRLNVSKTKLETNVVESSVKQDKLAGIELQDLGKTNAKTIQKQLLRLHAFGRRFPNSGALKRLLGDFHRKIARQKDTPEDLDVQIAIATDIGFVSPTAFPAIAGILSTLISFAPKQKKKNLWLRVLNKMRSVPYNGYLEIWLQRVILPCQSKISFESEEHICKIVNKQKTKLWENSWISSKDLKAALDCSKLLVGEPSSENEIILPEEIALFNECAWAY